MCLVINISTQWLCCMNLKWELVSNINVSQHLGILIKSLDSEINSNYQSIQYLFKELFSTVLTLLTFNCNICAVSDKERSEEESGHNDTKHSVDRVATWSRVWAGRTLSGTPWTPAQQAREFSTDQTAKERSARGWSTAQPKTQED